MANATQDARDEGRRLNAAKLKRCPRCSEVKSHSSFNARRRSWDGLAIYCRECARTYAAATLARRRSEWAEKDPYADPSLKWCTGCRTDLHRTEYATDPTRTDGLNWLCRVCDILKAETTRERYRTQWKSPDADPYAASSPKRCSYCRQTRPRADFPTNPSSCDGLYALCRGCAADVVSARRALVRGQFVEHVDRDVVWKRDQGICHLCGLAADPARWDLEHIHPIVHGGEHSYANTAVSHPSCNNSKGGKPWPDVSFDPAL